MAYQPTSSFLPSDRVDTVDSGRPDGPPRSEALSSPCPSVQDESAPYGDPLAEGGTWTPFDPLFEENRKLKFLLKEQDAELLELQTDFDAAVKRETPGLTRVALFNWERKFKEVVRLAGWYKALCEDEKRKNTALEKENAALKFKAAV